MQDESLKVHLLIGNDDISLCINIGTEGNVAVHLRRTESHMGWRKQLAIDHYSKATSVNKEKQVWCIEGAEMTSCRVIHSNHVKTGLHRSFLED